MALYDSAYKYDGIHKLSPKEIDEFERLRRSTKKGEGPAAADKYKAGVIDKRTAAGGYSTPKPATPVTPLESGIIPTPSFGPAPTPQPTPTPTPQPQPAPLPPPPPPAPDPKPQPSGPAYKTIDDFRQSAPWMRQNHVDEYNYRLKTQGQKAADDYVELVRNYYANEKKLSDFQGTALGEAELNHYNYLLGKEGKYAAEEYLNWARDWHAKNDPKPAPNTPPSPNPAPAPGPVLPTPMPIGVPDAPTKETVDPVALDIAHKVITAPDVNPNKDEVPPGPDPTKIDFGNPGSVAGAQDDANREALNRNLLINRPDQVNPYGSRTTTIDPVTGKLKIVDALSSEQQNLYNQEVKADTLGATLAGQMLGNYPIQPYDLNSINSQYGIPTANSFERAKWEDATYANLTRGLEDQYMRDKEALKQEMADTGNQIGSPRYQQAMQNFEDSYNRRRLEARSQATQMGGAEMANQFGLGLQAHNTAVGDYNSQYSMPISLAGSLLGIGTGSRDPSAGMVPFQSIEDKPVNYGDLYGTAGNLANAAADREQNQEQFDVTSEADMDKFFETLGLDKEKLDFMKQQWKIERQKILAERDALNRSNRGGGGGGGSNNGGSAFVPGQGGTTPP